MVRNLRTADPERSTLNFTVCAFAPTEKTAAQPAELSTSTERASRAFSAASCSSAVSSCERSTFFQKTKIAEDPPEKTK